MNVAYKQLKSINIKLSGRSSDVVSPSFSQGCQGSCVYCYMHRHIHSNDIKISENIDDILSSLDKFDYSGINKPNQTHEKYYTVDIGCNSDFSVDSKYTDWVKIFDFFKNSPTLMATFATKFFNKEFLNYNPEGKIRIRYSLLPENMSKIVDIGTIPVIKRIEQLQKFYEAGYSTHLNFSPVIISDTWKEDYIELFRQIKSNVNKDFLKQTACEVIFLTHNLKQHERNLNTFAEAESKIWQPEIQEEKVTAYNKEKNLRYKWQLKAKYIEEFKQLLKQELNIPIRYIF
jgi:DNA repair photolyase